MHQLITIRLHSGEKQLARFLSLCSHLIATVPPIVVATRGGGLALHAGIGMTLPGHPISVTRPCFSHELSYNLYSGHLFICIISK